MDYYQHEVEVAKGWDTTSNDLINDIAPLMSYPPEVFDLMTGRFTNEEYDARYPQTAKVINKMTSRRKKSRDPHTAARDITLSFINKDMFATICRKSGIGVALFNQYGRDINYLSDHEPDFVMSKSTMIGKIRRNVKIQFTNNPIGTSFLMPEDKFIKLHNMDTTMVIINTNTKQYAVVHVAFLKSSEVKSVYRFGKFMQQISIHPKRVPFYSEGNINKLIKDIF